MVQAFLRARDRLGLQGEVCAADMSKSAPALYFADKAFVLPKIGSETYLSALIDLCKNQEIALIVPTIDPELPFLAQNSALIKRECGAKVHISSQEVVAVCRDKEKTARFLAQNGFGVPKTYTESELDRGNYRLPLFIKPRGGSSSIGAYRVDSDEALRFLRTYVEDPIVQECAEGTEYTFDVFVDFDGDVVSVVPRVRIAVRGGEILKGKIDLNADLIADATRLVKALKPRGHVTVQGILGKDSVLRYLEINPRFGGGAPMSIAAGADSCEWLYRILAKMPIEKDKIKVRDGAAFARFDQSVAVEL